MCIFLPSLAGGGAERAISIVAGGLAEREFEVTLVLGQASGPYLAQLHAAVRVVDLQATSMWAALPRLAKHLRASQPQALLSAMNHANVTAALAHRMAGSKARLVLSERVHLASAFAEYRGLRMRVTGVMMRLTYPWAHRVIAVSEGVAMELQQRLGLPAEQVMTIYNPVVDSVLTSHAEAVPRHPWLQPGQTPVILAAGRLIAQKDFTTLLKAFALLRSARQVRLIILGEGELREALLEQAQTLGVAEHVSLPGFEANPFAAMRAARVFVLSSRFEGLPGVLIQAMACGTPVVSTDCPSGPSEILEAGVWGRLVPVGDVAAMARAIEACLDDDQPPDVRRRAASFSVDRAVTRYAEAMGYLPT